MRWSRTRKALTLALIPGILAIPASYVAHARLAVAGSLEPAIEWLAPGVRHDLPRDIGQLQAIALEQRARIRALEAQIQQNADRALQLAAEIKRLDLFGRLAESLRIDPARAVSARILRRGVNWDRGTQLIRCGRRDGIEEGCGVLAGSVVIGVVLEAGYAVSRVAWITTRGVQIPARIVETRQQGMLRGEGGPLRLRHIGHGRPSADHPLPAEGQVIVTAGLDGVFPSGVLIGRIAAVYRPDHELFHRITVEPAAHFGQVETVIVLRKQHVEVDAPPPAEPTDPVVGIEGAAR